MKKSMFVPRVAARVCLCTLAGVAGSASAFAAEPVVNADGDVAAPVSIVRSAHGQVIDWGETPVTPETVSITYITSQEEPEGDGPSSVAFTPDGGRIVISHRESRNLIVWDADTATLVDVWPVSGRAQAVAITPDGTRAVVPCVDIGSVSIIDLGTGAETMIPVGTSPGAVVITPDGSKAVVGNTFDSSLSVIDLNTNSVVQTIGGIGFTQTISFSTDGAIDLQYSKFQVVDNSHVINADRFNDAVQIVNIDTGAVTSLPVSDAPADVSVNALGTIAAVNHVGTVAEITVIDTVLQNIITTHATPATPFGSIVVNGAGNKAAYTVLNATRVIDLVTGVSGAALSTASLNDLLRSSDGNFAIGVGFNSSLIDLTAGTLVRQLNSTVSTAIGAVSPVGTRSAQCSTTFGEDLLIINATPTGGIEHNIFTGPNPEGDKVQYAAVSNDGSTAIGVNRISDNISVQDVGSGTLTSIVPVGLRPAAAKITPDGSKAVVANLDSFFTTIVDLNTNTPTNVAMGRRGSDVLLSPDGAFAFVPVVADGDGIYRINVATNSLAGPKLTTLADMGGIGTRTSQVTMSPDGTLIALAGSFTDVVTIVDAVNWSIVADVPVGDFPFDVEFSPDGTRLYVSNAFSDSVSVINVAGAGSSVINTFQAGDQPMDVFVTPDGNRLYVNIVASGARIGVFDVASGAEIDSFFRTPGEFFGGMVMDPAAGLFYIAEGVSSTTLGGDVGFSQTQSGHIRVVDAATQAQIDDIDIGRGAVGITLNASGTVAALPIVQSEEVTIVNFGGGCAPDLSGSSDPNDPGYGVPDGVLDISDFFYYLDQFVAMNFAVADLSGSSDPNDPGYGVPDGVIDISDFFYYLDTFVAGCP